MHATVLLFYEINKPNLQKIHIIIIIIINKVLIKVTLNKVIAGALYISVAETL